MVGYEAMAMIRKGQVHNVGDRDMQAQAGVLHGGGLWCSRVG